MRFRIVIEEEQESSVMEGPYHDDWASLTDFTMPAWYEKAKFGIFIHWGL